MPSIRDTVAAFNSIYEANPETSKATFFAKRWPDIPAGSELTDAAQTHVDTAYMAAMGEAFFGRVRSVYGADVRSWDPDGDMPAETSMVSKLAPPGMSRGDALAGSIEAFQGEGPAEETAPVSAFSTETTWPSHVARTEGPPQPPGEAQQPKTWRSLLPMKEEETGIVRYDLGDPAYHGLHPLHGAEADAGVRTVITAGEGIREQQDWRESMPGLASAMRAKAGEVPGGQEWSEGMGAYGFGDEPEPKPTPAQVAEAEAKGERGGWPEVEPPEKEDIYDIGVASVGSALAEAVSESGPEFGKLVMRATVRNIGRAGGATLGLAYDAYKALENTAAVIGVDMYADTLKGLQAMLDDPNLTLEKRMFLKTQANALLEAREDARGTLARNSIRVLEHIDMMEADLQNRLGAGSAWQRVGQFAWNAVTDTTDLGMAIAHLLTVDMFGFEESQYEAQSKNALEYAARTLETGWGKGLDLTGGLVGATLAMAGSIVPALLPEGVELGSAKGSDTFVPAAIEARPISTLLFFHGSIKAGMLREMSAFEAATRVALSEGKAAPVMGAKLKLYTKVFEKGNALKAELKKTTARAFKGTRLGAWAAEKGVGAKRLWDDSMWELDKRSSKLANDLIRKTRGTHSAWLGVTQSLANTIGKLGVRKPIERMTAAELVGELKRSGVDPKAALVERAGGAEAAAAMTLDQKMSVARRAVDDTRRADVRGVSVEEVAADRPQQTKADMAADRHHAMFGHAEKYIERLWEAAFDKYGRPPRRKEMLGPDHPLRDPYRKAKDAERALEGGGWTDPAIYAEAMDALAAVAERVEVLVGKRPSGIFGEVKGAGEAAFAEIAAEAAAAKVEIAAEAALHRPLAELAARERVAKGKADPAEAPLRQEPPPSELAAMERAALEAEPVLGEGQTAQGATAGVLDTSIRRELTDRPMPDAPQGPRELHPNIELASVGERYHADIIKAADEGWVPHKQGGRQSAEGIYPDEWPAFVAAAKEKGVVITAETPVDTMRSLAKDWFNREGNSRPSAAVRNGQHEFTPAERLMFVAKTTEHMHAGRSFNKSEYQAYADVLNARGMNVPPDAFAMGLEVPNWVKVEKGQQAPPAPTRPPRTTGEVSQMDFAELERKINERHPQPEAIFDENGDPVGTPGPTDRFRGTYDDAEGLAKLIHIAEEAAGRKMSTVSDGSPPSMVPHKGTPTPPGGWYSPEGTPVRTRGGIQGTLGLETMDRPSLHRESLQKIQRIADDTNMPAEILAGWFTDAIDWQSKMGILRSRILRRKLLKIGERNAKLTARPGLLGGRDMKAFRGRMNSAMKAMSDGRWHRGKVDLPGEKGAFDIVQTARDMLSKDPLLERAAMQDAVLATGFEIAETAREARILAVGRAAYARAPANRRKALLESFSVAEDGGGFSMLRVDPELMRADLLSTNYKMKMPDGRMRAPTKGETTMVEGLLGRYEKIDTTFGGSFETSVAGRLGLTDEGAKSAWVTKRFNDTMRLEYATRTAIDHAGFIYRAIRTAKRGLVPLSLSTTIGNTLSDYVMAVMETGNPLVAREVIAEARGWKSYREGHLSRKENKAQYDMYEYIEGTGVVDVTLLEAEIGHAQAYKGVLSWIAEQGPSGAKGPLENLGVAADKYWNTPLLGAFRGATNAFKVWKTIKAYKEVSAYVDRMLPGEKFGMEVQRNNRIQLRRGPDVDGVGTVERMDGTQLTDRQWGRYLANMGKVTSDRKFLDYADAPVLPKKVRATPVINMTGASMFYMYYNGTLFIPGLKKGVLRYLYDPNPAFWSENLSVRADMATTAAKANLAVYAMAHGARASMIEGESEIRSRMGYERRVPARAAVRVTENPGLLDFYNLAHTDPTESTSNFVRLLLTAGLAVGEQLPHDDWMSAARRWWNDETVDELEVLYPRDGNGDLDLNLDKVTDPGERRWFKRARMMHAKSLSGGLAVARDLAALGGLGGGPLLEFMSGLQEDAKRERATDMDEIFRKFSGMTFGATAGRFTNIVISMVSPGSKLSSFRYSLRDPEKFALLPMDARSKQLARWAFRTALARSWNSFNWVDEGVKEYEGGMRTAFDAEFISHLRIHRDTYDALATGEGEEAVKQGKIADGFNDKIIELEDIMNTALEEVMENSNKMTKIIEDEEAIAPMPPAQRSRERAAQREKRETGLEPRQERKDARRRSESIGKRRDLRSSWPGRKFPKPPAEAP